MKSDQESAQDKVEISKRDKFWVALAVAAFLILFALLLIFGDNMLSSLI